MASNYKVLLDRAQSRGQQLLNLSLKRNEEKKKTSNTGNSSNMLNNNEGNENQYPGTDNNLNILRDHESSEIMDTINHDSAPHSSATNILLEHGYFKTTTNDVSFETVSNSDTEAYSSGSEYLPSNLEQSMQSDNDSDDEQIEVEVVTDNTFVIDAPKKAKKGFPKKSQKKINQELRLRGLQYKGYKKIITDNSARSYKMVNDRPARKIGINCTSRACLKSQLRKCNSITDEHRKELFQKFWNNMNWGERKVFVRGLIESKGKAKSTVQSSRRAMTFSYKLPVGDEKITVCKNFFLSTFGLKETQVRKWLKNSDHGIPSPAGKNSNTSNRATPRASATEFLEGIPTLPSHYCRNSSTKKYLEPDITSMSKLYSIYSDYCTSNNKTRASRNILRNEFQKLNFSFFQPKKDQCDTCCGFNTGNISEELYQSHVNGKEMARREKANDKEACINGQNTSVWTMDLQAVLLSPRLLASALYYKTKLCCHNFTMYNLKTKHVICYFWDESEGDICATNFASCICDALQCIVDNDPLIDEIILYSDGCGYQNRNITVSNAILEFVQRTNKTVLQKFLQKGHTQMEVDSVHSVIERQLKNRSIYFPGDYVRIMQECRRGQPYEVKELKYDFFKDYKAVRYYDSIRPGRSAGDHQVHHLRALKYVANKIMYKVNFEDEWADLPQRQRNTVGPITPLYKSPQNIKKTKFDHLQQLKAVMPAIYHSFYDLLSHSN